tara:strand:- start:1699 stop:1893 length:195 start_codon:yes stop_codon:yes gene_type:complete
MKRSEEIQDYMRNATRLYSDIVDGNVNYKVIERVHSHLALNREARVIWDETELIKQQIQEGISP